LFSFHWSHPCSSRPSEFSGRGTRESFFGAACSPSVLFWTKRSNNSRLGSRFSSFRQVEAPLVACPGTAFFSRRIFLWNWTRADVHAFFRLSFPAFPLTRTFSIFFPSCPQLIPPGPVLLTPPRRVSSPLPPPRPLTFHVLHARNCPSSPYGTSQHAFPSFGYQSVLLPSNPKPCSFLWQ